MKSEVIFFIELAVSFLPFIFFVFLNGKANVKKENRHRQYIMPVFAVVYSIVILIFLDQLSAVVMEKFLQFADLFDRIKIHFVADFIDTGTLNANIIKAGVLQDENANTTFNLVTGALTSKNLTIDSTYFKLNNTGKITSITADGRKLEMNMGKITGYKVDGTQSAALEIGDGYFNIIIM